VAKVTFIGAGSLGFARRLIIDVLNCPAMRDTHFCLMDVDPKRLDYTRRIGERIIREQKMPAKVTATTDRREALRDADFVVIMLLAHGVEPIEAEYRIPLKHGIDQCVGDTLGPGGVFRFLRTAPMILDVCRDVMDVAKPNCWVLNYTNPMSMLTWAAYRGCPGIKFVGLCHSVQGTTEMLAKAIDVPYEDVRYWVGGINHQAWVLQFRHKDGTDLYPRLKEALPKSPRNKPGIADGEMVRIMMMQHLGYFVTESSGHNSEYNPWFRKRSDLIEKYTGPDFAGESGFIARAYGKDREGWEKGLEDQVNQADPIDFVRSHEYGSGIINAIWTDAPFRIYGNVRNDGLITSLPEGCCVEVPCLVDGHGVNPCFVGELPPQCAALNRMNVSEHELAVAAFFEHSRERLYQSLYYDPLTAAKLSLPEIRAMADEMIAVETQHGWLPPLR